MSVSNPTSLINPILLSQNTLFISMKIVNLSESNRQFTIKPLSGRLNARPYNKLDKEVADFKECKEGLTMPYNTKCFHLKTGTLQE